jgi:glycosyltransferase involved in cell wall biosynthesis
MTVAARKRSDLRVMHVIASLSGYGAEHFIADLLPLLAQGGAQVAALTVYSSKERDAEGCQGVRVFDAARTGRMDTAFFPRMVRAVRRFAPDIVHTHMHNGKYWGRLAAVAAGVRRIVHTEHDPNFSPNGLERMADAALARRTSRFVAFSCGHRARLASAEGIPLGKIVVIPNGIRIRDLPPGARARGRVLLGADAGELAVIMIGRLEHQKNHALALRAFVLLPEILARRTRLYVVGAGSLEPDLRELCQTLRIAHAVTFMGFRQDAFELLAGADAVLMTSRSEAMPIALIEAMSLAIPVASAPWAGADEMLDRGALGYVAATFSPDDVAGALAAALSDSTGAHLKADAAQAKAFVEYDVRTAAQRHGQLYRELVSAS